MTTRARRRGYDLWALRSLYALGTYLYLGSRACGVRPCPSGARLSFTDPCEFNAKSIRGRPYVIRYSMECARGDPAAAAARRERRAVHRMRMRCVPRVCLDETEPFAARAARAA